MYASSPICCGDVICGGRCSLWHYWGLSLGCVRDNRTVLTVYSPHGPDLLSYYEAAFEKAYPSIDVQWVDMGSQEILDRVRGEAVNPQADVWFGAPSESFVARGARAAIRSLPPQLGPAQFQQKRTMCRIYGMGRF